MNKQLPVWKLISRSLQKDIPVMLLYVLESHGSSPGRAGFCMSINSLGEMEGSIGGGIMEHKFVEMAKVSLKNGEVINSIYKQIHDKESLHFQSGMICSGEQTNFLYGLKREDIQPINEIISCIESYGVGKLRFSPDGISFSKDLSEDILEFHQEHEDEWIYEEKVGCQNNLHIVGGGHCALALSRIAERMDFLVIVFDDRENLNTFLNNKYANEKKVVQDYAEVSSLISPGNNSYVVVMTMGYRTDDIVVRSLLDKQFRYFGILGSKAKIEKMFAQYRAEGISEDALSKIHAPIGIQINSQTPEEIAISIAAEIIRVKNAQKSV